MSLVPPRKFRTACDRCYALKERCVRGLSAICGRCERLGLVCSIARPVRPIGRRPRPPRKASSANICLSLRERLHRDLSASEEELIVFLLDRPDSLECLVVAPSFQDAQQRSLAASLSASFPLLKDAYLACAGALHSLQAGMSADEVRAMSLGHASSAMKTLRSLDVTSSEDAALCLALGAALARFVYSAVGDGVAHICHYCISASAPHMATAAIDKGMESDYSFLILLEIMECLVHRRKPTTKHSPQLQDRIDRHLGLCLPMLPHFHDICTVSHTLVRGNSTQCLARVYQKLDQIEAAVQNWVPSNSSQLTQYFKRAEVVNLLAQAKVYRLAALLVILRLRYTFGSEDAKADVLSKEIMMELRLSKAITMQPLRCVTLPFIIAAVEVRDTDMRLETLSVVDDYVDRFALVIRTATKTFLMRVWHERDSKTTSCWFDSVSKPCVVLNAIDSASFAEITQ